MRWDLAPGEERLLKMCGALDGSVKWIERLGDTEIDFNRGDGRSKGQRGKRRIHRCQYGRDTEKKAPRAEVPYLRHWFWSTAPAGTLN